jgi:hypothetical protein
MSDSGKGTLEFVHDLGKEVAVLVPSWDAYQDVWKPFFHCFFKYWPDCPYPVYLGSNHLSYPDSRISSILVGDDVDYTTNLIAMLKQIEQDWTIVWVEDLLLNAPVDTTRVCKLIILAQRRQIGHLRLTPTRYSLVSVAAASAVDVETGEIGELLKGAKYRVGLTVGLWKKSVLLQLLRPGETAWDIERGGTVRSFDLEDRFYCVLPKGEPVFSIVNGVGKRGWTREGAALLKQEGLQDYLGKRPIQTYWSYIYTKAYVRIRYVLFRLWKKVKSPLRSGTL